MTTNPFQVVKDFERALCEYTGAPYAVTTTSCTMALLLAVAYYYERERWLAMEADNLINFGMEVSIPKRTYVGVAYAIREAGPRVRFREEAWSGEYQLEPLPVWDSARWFTGGMYNSGTAEKRRGYRPMNGMVCVSFHWAKTLGIQQGGAILHNNHEADAWLRRARFDGRMEGVPPTLDTFALRRAWHAYMSPEVAAAGLVRLAGLSRENEPLPNDDYPDLSQLEAFR